MQPKLTEKTAAAIIDKLTRGERVVDLAREYGVSKTLIVFLKKNQIWKQVPRPRGKPHLELRPHKRLNPEEVQEVLRLLAESDIPQRAIAEQMGVSESLISIVKRRYGLRGSQPRERSRPQNSKDTGQRQ